MITGRGSQTRSGVTMINQDRHFVGRLCLLREGEFNQKWIPSIVVGVSDPVSSTASRDYIGGDMSGTGNGYFNRNFIVLSKHLYSAWGEFGVHAGYQFNRRTYYPIDGICLGVNWSPVRIKDKGILDKINIIAEYDSRTVNIGVIASLWQSHIEAMFEIQSLKWLNFVYVIKCG